MLRFFLIFCVNKSILKVIKRIKNFHTVCSAGNLILKALTLLGGIGPSRGYIEDMICVFEEFVF